MSVDMLAFGKINQQQKHISGQLSNYPLWDINNHLFTTELVCLRAFDLETITNLPPDVNMHSLSNEWPFITPVQSDGMWCNKQSANPLNRIADVHNHSMCSYTYTKHVQTFQTGTFVLISSPCIRTTVTKWSEDNGPWHLSLYSSREFVNWLSCVRVSQFP